MQGTITESVRKQYEAYSYPPPIEEAAAFAPSVSDVAIGASFVR